MAEPSGIDVTKQSLQHIGAFDADVRRKLKEEVGKALRADNTSSRSIADAIKAVINGDEKTRPRTDAERERLEREATVIGDKLIGIKNADRNPNRAIQAFNDGVDRVSSLPEWTGIGVGGAAGVAAAVATDIGDWKSFGGIMKKLMLVGAGIGVGIAVNNDYGLRDQAMQAVGLKDKPASPNR